MDEVTAKSIVIDFKKITLLQNGKTVVAPLPLVNSLDGTLVMHKVEKVLEDGGKSKKKKVESYFININDVEFDAPEQITTKMFGAMSGRKVFNSVFAYEFSPYDVVIADNGIKANVESIVDYGAEKFAKCAVGESIVYIKVNEDISGEIFLQPNMNKLGVTEKDRDIKIV